MTSSGDTDKSGDERTTPSERPAAPGDARRDPGAADPTPPSESERAAAARTNPLRSPADANRGGEQDGSGGAAGSRGGQTPPATNSGAAPSGGAPELRISASMLSAQPSASSKPDKTPPPAGPKPEETPPTTAGKSRYRRRVKRLATPVEPVVISPLRLVWPRANSRKAARVASRYGFAGFVVALLWAMVAVRPEAIDQALAFSSSAAAVAVAIGAIAVVALTVVGYFHHSRLAALLALAGVISLVVLEHQAMPVGLVKTAGHAFIVYLLLHGVHGTIAFHIFGRRKRRRRSNYRYNRD